MIPRILHDRPNSTHQRRRRGQRLSGIPKRRPVRRRAERGASTGRERQLLNLPFAREAVQLLFRENQAVTDADLKYSSGRWNERERGNPRMMPGQNLFRHTDGSGQIPSMRAVLDAQRLLRVCHVSCPLVSR